MKFNKEFFEIERERLGKESAQYVVRRFLIIGKSSANYIEI